MKKIVLLLALFSPSAFALNVGDSIRIDRSQIVCQDQAAPRPRPPRCSYCYDYSQPTERATVAIRGSVEGVRNFATVVTSCLALDGILDGLANPVAFDVQSITTQKMPGNIVMEYVTIQLDGRNPIQFRGSKQQ